MIRSINIAIIDRFVSGEELSKVSAHDRIISSSFLYADFIGLVQNAVRAAQKQMNIAVERDYEVFLCDMYADAIASQIINLFRNEQPVDKDRTLSYISLVFKVSLRELLLCAPKDIYGA